MSGTILPNGVRASLARARIWFRRWAESPRLGAYRRCGEPNWAAPVMQSCAVSTRSLRVRRPLANRMRAIGWGIRGS